MKNLFLEISQNSQKNTCTEACVSIEKETLTQVFLCQHCGISKNIFSYRTPTVAAMVLQELVFSKVAEVMFSF